MKACGLLSLALVALVSIGPLTITADAQKEQKPTVQIPQPGVPQIMTLEGTFIRAAYNNEGYVILGYRVANLSISDEWMLLEFGATVRDGVDSYILKRDAVTLETPDGKTIPMAPVMEYRKANLSALNNRAKIQRESINYFPPSVRQPCRVGFFSDLEDRAMPFDQVELSYTRGCVGRLFFQVPGGITYGQHWLNVKFQNSLVRVPFRILTKDEEKLLSRNYKDIKKQVQDAFRKKS